MRKIISGGMTGADRAGLDAALEQGIEHGGYCSYKHQADDGRIPEHYKLLDTPYMAYSYCTRANIQAADGTVVFTYGSDSSHFDPRGPSGTLMTQRMARRAKKPLCTVDLDSLGVDGAVSLIMTWLDDCESLGRPIEVLHVAGKCEKKCPGTYKIVKSVMLRVLEACGERAEPKTPKKEYEANEQE